MGFVARLNFPFEDHPCRAYVHTGGFNDTYHGCFSEARKYLFSVIGPLSIQKDLFSQSDFLLAAIWGSGGDKILDLFGLSDISSKWLGNPDVSAWVFKNGVYQHTPQITCGDTLILLGREEEFRRSRTDLSDYCKSFPHLGDLEPGKTIEYTRGGGDMSTKFSAHQPGGVC